MICLNIVFFNQKRVRTIRIDKSVKSLTPLFYLKSRLILFFSNNYKMILINRNKINASYTVEVSIKMS